MPLHTRLCNNTLQLTATTQCNNRLQHRLRLQGVQKFPHLLRHCTQHTSTHCNTLQQHTATTTLQLYAATTRCNNTLQHRLRLQGVKSILTTYVKVMSRKSTHIVAHCNTLQQYTAKTHCNNTLQQHTATTHCNTGCGYRE